ncbi:MAG: hypothetical protein AUK03_02705 [Anaerolineae bacterium CG2_30_64_16]|nr:MAG: hypothetical protein AUK03_02705 [Anaerolineae bacterium CG2_30_64_16]
MSDIETFEAVIQSRWPGPPGEKAARYVGHFTDRTRTGSKIVAKVVGNHGAYTVSIAAGGGGVTSACSCYIGKGGYCHHCVALAHTFLRDPGSFREIQPTPREAVGGLPELQAYLAGVTLEELLAQLKAHRITQKAFAEGIGMSPRHLDAIKSAELHNHFFHELGATKLAALWVVEHLEKPKADSHAGVNR